MRGGPSGPPQFVAGGSFVRHALGFVARFRQGQPTPGGGIMARRGVAEALAAASLFCAPAHAGPLSPQAPAIQLALPNSGPRGERSHAVDEPILDLPLFWAWAATLRDPAAIDVDGVSAPLPAGTVLAQQVLVDGSGG